MIDDSIGFRQLPWQPVLDKRFGQHVGGVTRNFGGADWRLGRQRGLDLSVLPRSYEGPRQRHMARCHWSRTDAIRKRLARVTPRFAASGLDLTSSGPAGVRHAGKAN
jgi:hypothetical protein